MVFMVVNCQAWMNTASDEQVVVYLLSKNSLVDEHRI